MSEVEGQYPHLYPLSPLGLGEAWVESLGSYLRRLAALHGVTARRVIEYCFLRYSGRNFKRESPVSLLSQSLGAYCRPNKFVNELVSYLMHEFPDGGVHSTTFLSLGSALTRVRSGFRTDFHWCPVCLHDDIEIGQGVPYFRLGWQFAHVHTCPVHGCGLESRCPHCDRKQDGVGFAPACDVCRGCGGSLGAKAVERGKPVIATELQMWDLVERISKEPDLIFTEGGVNNVVEPIYDKAWSEHREEELWAVLPKSLCIAIEQKTTTISFDVVRRVALHLEIPIDKLLEGDTSNINERLIPFVDSGLVEQQFSQHKRKRHDVAKLRSRLVDLFSTLPIDYWPPLSEVAHSLDISRDGLRHLFSDVSTFIVEQHREQVKRERDAIISRCRDYLRDYVVSCELSARSPMKKEALRYVNRIEHVPKNIVRELLAEGFGCFFGGGDGQ